MRICFYGTYDIGSTRNLVLARALGCAGVELLACHQGVWPSTEGRLAAARSWRARLALGLRWLRAQGRLAAQHRRLPVYAMLLVPYPGHADMPLARLLAWLRRRPAVLDAFISLYETVVEDRTLCGPRSPLAWALWLADWLALHLADRVLVDTAANADFLAARYRVRRARFIVVPVGADEEVYAPQRKSPLPSLREGGGPPPGEGRRSPLVGLCILYFGAFIPLHGVEHILDAANALRDEPDIQFELIGDGQTYAAAVQQAAQLGLDNVAFGLRWLDPPALAQRIAQADVCLGIFGCSAKAARVIPSKAYIALAMGVPLLTMNSPGAREALVHGESAYLCTPASGAALAEALRALRDPGLRARLAAGGRALFERRFTAERIGAVLLEELAQLR